MTIAFDGTNYFGFVASRDNNRLVRLEYGQLFALVKNGGNNQLSVMSFGNSSANNTLTGQNIALPNAQGLLHVSAVKDCGQW